MKKKTTGNPADRSSTQTSPSELSDHTDQRQQWQQPWHRQRQKSIANSVASTDTDARLSRQAIFEKRRALQIQEDSDSTFSEDVIDAYVKLLQEENKTQGRVVILPATFWKTQSGKQPTSLPTGLPALLAKNNDSVVFPIYQNGPDRETATTKKGWYGLFIGRITDKEFVFAVEFLDHLLQSQLDLLDSYTKGNGKEKRRLLQLHAKKTTRIAAQLLHEEQIGQSSGGQALARQSTVGQPGSSAAAIVTRQPTGPRIGTIPIGPANHLWTSNAQAAPSAPSSPSRLRPPVSHKTVPETARMEALITPGAPEATRSRAASAEVDASASPQTVVGEANHIDTGSGTNRAFVLR